MKPSNQSPAKKVSRLIACFFISVFAQTVNAQESPLYIGLSHVVSGSGLAAAPIFSLGYINNNTSVELGLKFQPKAGRPTGVDVRVNYSLTSFPGGRAWLYTFADASYNHRAFLSRPTLNREVFIFPEAKTVYENLQLSTVEMQAGFGVKVDHSRRIRSNYGIGFGGYFTRGSEEVCAMMYRERSAPTLMFTLGLTCNLR